MINDSAGRPRTYAMHDAFVTGLVRESREIASRGAAASVDEDVRKVFELAAPLIVGNARW